MIEYYLYWVSVGLLALLYLASAAMYLTKPNFVKSEQAKMGFSAPFLVTFLIVVKILGVAAILSRISVTLSDLAYAGMFYHLILSGLAHLGIKKPKGAIPAFVGMLLLVTSFLTQNAVREIPSPYLPPVSTEQSVTR